MTTYLTGSFTTACSARGWAMAHLVTPFLRQVHYIGGSFGERWRPTPARVERLLEEQGFHVAYQSSNDNPWCIVYVVTVACRDPECHRGRLIFAKTAQDTGVIHFGLADAD